MQLLPLLEKIHRQFLKAKRLRHFVMTEHFDAVWRSLTDDQQNELITLINKGADSDEVRMFLNGLSEDMSTFSLSKLRVIARQYRIKNYYQLTRKNLIKEIKDVKDANCKSIT
jgi:hypothetical protein